MLRSIRHTLLLSLPTFSISSMMPSGVIAEEYIDGLERLRNRLGISKADTEKLLGVNTRNRVGEVVKTLVDQWKADTGASERKNEQEKKDKSRDPISSEDNVVRDIHNVPSIHCCPRALNHPFTFSLPAWVHGNRS